MNIRIYLSAIAVMGDSSSIPKCQYNPSFMKTTKASLKLLHKKPKCQWPIYPLQVILSLQLS